MSTAEVKGTGKRGHIVADTLLLMMFLGLRKLGNICCGHKMFLNKIRNIFCVPDTKFVSATNVARGQMGKHLCRQQCVRNNAASFASTLRFSHTDRLRLVDKMFDISPNKKSSLHRHAIKKKRSNHVGENPSENHTVLK